MESEQEIVMDEHQMALLEQIKRQKDQLIHYTLESANFAKLLEATRDRLDDMTNERDALKTAIAAFQSDSRGMQLEILILRLVCVVMGLGLILSFGVKIL